MFKKTSFLKNTNGTVAIIFSLALVPVIGLIGSAIDYSRAQEVKFNLQNASDAAALAMTREMGRIKNDAELKEIGARFFEANWKRSEPATITAIQINRKEGGTRVEAESEVQATLLKVLGVHDLDIKAEAQANLSQEIFEIALVLDNTGSMAPYMNDLRQASRDFIKIIDSIGTDNTSIALVPYVGAVNIGRTQERYLDKRGDNIHHASLMEGKYLGRISGCVDPNAPAYVPRRSSPPSSYRRPAPQRPRGQATDGAFLQPHYLKKGNAISDFMASIYSVLSPSKAHANSLYNAILGADTCTYFNPRKISHWTLFNNLSGVSWKGCVEARPEPFDVRDETPNSNANTQFVPYFWMDDVDPYTASAANKANNWMLDTPFITNTNMAGSQSGRTFSAIKYRPNASKNIDQIPPATSGPNKACPDPIRPLTKNMQSLKSAINTMSHWEGSGTVISQGVAWGWRVLSPSAPFSEGKPYGKANKIMVLMTDGDNSVLDSNNNATYSHYSAYGYLKDGRFGKNANFANAKHYLDRRTQQVCRNAKQEGIIIYAVSLGLSDPTSLSLMAECATDAEKVYKADDGKQLVRAFNDIAADISKLRLTK